MNEREIFDKALAMTDQKEQASFLEKACGTDVAQRKRLEEMLEAHQRLGSFLEQPAVPLGPTLDPIVIEKPGMSIGPYKLLQEIGQGGMGMVFMAEQHEPVRRKVALKIIKPGMDSRQVLARFEAERQALSLMDHPNIAKVLDAGTTSSGRPYFVMELVKGQPITQYCDEHQLTPRERLELLLPVCQAIQHAHQKGIIHRDIKPSNILVAEYDQMPLPKVIDFGVAKAISQPLTDRTLFTGFGQVVGTLEYMSPEQAKVNQLDIDTRSDIYSLGVLMYELLTGFTPFDKQRLREAAWDEMLRIIREEEPPKPSTRLFESKDSLPSISALRHMDPAKLTKMVQGELDWIVMKALEKDRNRRYETANGFAMDLQRYLNDEAVSACPPSAGYRLRKFVRKNRRVLSAGLAFVALLIVSTIAAVFAAVQSAELAEREHELRATAELSTTKEKQAKEALEWNLYLQRIALAQQELLAGNTGRAEEILDECPASARGWEWFYLKRARPGNPLVLRGNYTIAFSADSRFMAHRKGNVIEILDPANGKARKALTGTNFVESHGIAFHPRTGEPIVAGGDYSSGKVKIWNMDTGQEIHSLDGHRQRLRSVAFSPDGQQLAAGSITKGIRVWDWNERKLLFDLATENGISRIVYNPKGQRAAVGVWAQNHEVAIYDAATWRVLRTIGGKKRPIEALAYSPDGRQVTTAGTDGLIIVWDEATGKLLQTLAGHDNVVHDLVYSPDGKRIISAGWDKTIKIWDTRTGGELLTLRGHTDEIRKLAISPDGHYLLSGGADGVRVWNASPVRDITGTEAISLPGHTSIVRTVKFSPDGKFLASAGIDRVIKLWNAEMLGKRTELVGELKGHVDQVWNLTFSPDSRQLTSADWNGGVKIWDMASQRELVTYPIIGFVRGIAFHPAGRLIATNQNTNINLWDTKTRQMTGSLFLRESGGNCFGLAYSPDGKLLTVGFGHGVKIFDTEAMVESHSYQHQNAVFSVAFSPDGKRHASASFDQTVKIWDPVGRQELCTLQGHGERVTNVAFSRDSKLVASGSGDSTVRLWDAVLGEEIAVLRGHTGYVWGLDFSPDGKWLASTGGHHNKGEVKIWDMSQYRERASAVKAALQDTLRRDANSAEAHFKLGQHLQRELAWLEAANYFQTAIRIQADYSKARDELARSLLLAARGSSHEDVVAEYRKAIAAVPDHSTLHFDLGRVYARSMQWKEAAASYARGLELDPKNIRAWYYGVPLLLAADDVNGYRRLCEQMLKRFGDTKDPVMAEWTVMTCALAPNGVTELNRLVRLGDLAVAGAEKQWNFRYLSRAKGLAELRAGNPVEAVKWLERSVPGTTRSPGDAGYLAALAIARHRSGKSEEAKTTIASAKKLMLEWKMSDPTLSNWPDVWPDWLHANILIREAETLAKEP